MTAPDFGRPHVVILGAGASLQAFPNGDKHGRKLPLMWNLVDVVGLAPLLDQAGIGDYRDNFEKFYSDLATSGRNQDVVEKINQAVFDYFAKMELPDEPTLYDHLVMSLREKDVIATFNWDPFLVQAIARNRRKKVPSTLFLHGNTAVGYCAEHKPIGVGKRGQLCRRCGKELVDSRLLYPVAKDYRSDPFLEKNWALLQDELRAAFMLTLFGYSAPVSDAVAIDLLRSAWGTPEERTLEQVEIIDIKENDELRQTWRQFIHSHHYQTTKSFFDSSIGLSPRRSCEDMWASLMDLTFLDPNPAPREPSWDEFHDFYDQLIEDETAHQR